MNWDVFITCAITGAGDTTGRSPHVPITPQQIAKSAIDAAKAGAAVVHIHVRDPLTGKGSRDTGLYAEVADTNGLAGDRATGVKSNFARSFQAESPSGTWLQSADGTWTQKP